MLLTRKILYYPLPPILFNGEAIPFSHSVKFLGIYLDPNLSWKNHLTYVQRKLSSVCGILHSIRGKIPLKIAKTIYYSLAYPYFIYGNTVWSAASMSKLKPLITSQKRLIRIIARRGWLEHTAPLFKELNILSFVDICSLMTSTFVYKTLNGHIDSPIVFLYRPGAIFPLLLSVN